MNSCILKWLEVSVQSETKWVTNRRLWEFSNGSLVLKHISNTSNRFLWNNCLLKQLYDSGRYQFLEIIYGSGQVLEALCSMEGLWEVLKPIQNQVNCLNSCHCEISVPSGSWSMQKNSSDWELTVLCFPWWFHRLNQQIRLSNHSLSAYKKTVKSIDVVWDKAVPNVWVSTMWDLDWISKQEWLPLSRWNQFGYLEVFMGKKGWVISQRKATVRTHWEKRTTDVESLKNSVSFEKNVYSFYTTLSSFVSFCFKQW